MEVLMADSVAVGITSSSKEQSRTLGKLAGRRIRLKGQSLQLPNIREGRALALLLSDQPARKDERGRLIVECRDIGGVSDLISLLTAIEVDQSGFQMSADVSPVWQQLHDFEIGDKEAARLAADPWVTMERVNAWIAYLEHHAKSFTKGGRVQGMLFSRLRDHIPAPQGPWSQRQDEQAPLPEMRIPDEHNEVGSLSIHQDLDGSGTSPAAIWQTAYEELKLQMARETFDSWLLDSQLVDYRNTNDLPMYIIQVRNQHAKAWLEGRLHKPILRTLAAIAGQEVGISFVLPE
jgi:hypothetical protein